MRIYQPMNQKIVEFSAKSEFLSVFKQSFVDNSSLQSAAALSYTSLFSLVPLTAVSLAIVSAFPVFDAVSLQMQDFVFENFVPASGEVIQQHLQDFLSKAKKLTVPGIFALLITALMMMATIERTLNGVWKVSQHRKLFNRFIVYWSVISLGPLLMGGGLAISSYIVSMPFISQTATVIEDAFGFVRVIPLVMEFSAFSLLYIIVPNAQVPVRDAAIGGIFAAILFEIAKYGFTYFVTHFASYETLYGALATIPIFLVWLYVSWLVALTGAEFTRSLQIARLPSTEISESGSADGLTLSYVLLGYLWEAQQSGDQLSAFALSDKEPKFDEQKILENLDLLQGAKLVEKVGQDCWVLVRYLGNFSVLNLIRSCDYNVPMKPQNEFANDSLNALVTLLKPLYETAENTLDVPLAELYTNNYR